MRKRSIALRLLFLFCLVLSPAFAKKKPPLRPVNINTAKSEELQQVPGIGPSTADKILQMRKSYGAFKSVDDLLAIRGLGPKRLDKMKKYLSVGKPASPAQTVPAKNCAGCPKAKGPPQKAGPTTAAPAKAPATSAKAGTPPATSAGKPSLPAEAEEQ